MTLIQYFNFFLKKYNRPVVVVFNRILKERLNAYSNQIFYLDFFEKLLNESGGFNTEYELDGTHLNPKYIPLLTEELNKAFNSFKK